MFILSAALGYCWFRSHSENKKLGITNQQLRERVAELEGAHAASRGMQVGLDPGAFGPKTASVMGVGPCRSGSPKPSSPPAYDRQVGMYRKGSMDKGNMEGGEYVYLPQQQEEKQQPQYQQPQYQQQGTQEQYTMSMAEFHYPRYRNGAAPSAVPVSPVEQQRSGQ